MMRTSTFFYQGSESDEQSDDENSDDSWTVTPCRTRSSLKPTAAVKSPTAKQEKDEDAGSEHFAAYIAGRLSKIKSDKKRKNLEDEIIDLVRKCTLND